MKVRQKDKQTYRQTGKLSDNLLFLDLKHSFSYENTCKAFIVSNSLDLQMFCQFGEFLEIFFWFFSKVNESQDTKQKSFNFFKCNNKI